MPGQSRESPGALHRGLGKSVTQNQNSEAKPTIRTVLKALESNNYQQAYALVFATLTQQNPEETRLEHRVLRALKNQPHFGRIFADLANPTATVSQPAADALLQATKKPGKQLPAAITLSLVLLAVRTNEDAITKSDEFGEWSEANEILVLNTAFRDWALDDQRTS